MLVLLDFSGLIIETLSNFYAAFLGCFYGCFPEVPIGFTVGFYGFLEYRLIFMAFFESDLLPEAFRFLWLIYWYMNKFLWEFFSGLITFTGM